VEKIDFHINVKPVSINFECPHCHLDAEIQWNELCVPEYWGDDWGAVLCPYCEQEVELGDYDYD
jgi:hypothetical protein